MTDFLPAVLNEFRRHKRLADGALAQLDDEQFFRRPAPHANPVAVIVKHLAGNLASRWTGFLSGDGEKPGRDRDAEFVLTEQDTRAALTAAWERGWAAALGAVEALSDADLGRTVTIRGEPHTVTQALLRGAGHASYHTGQVLYLVRLLRPDAAWQTVPPGESRTYSVPYLGGGPGRG
jgi:uncharacterized damage-inducible protein DinB